jgi:hypothetical protein
MQMSVAAIVGSLVSVNVGLPREIEWRGKTYRTSIWKSPGEQRAVFVYQMDSYRHWSTFLNRDDLTPG